MQGNIKPKEDEFDSDENNNFDMMDLSHQLEIIYGKDFLENLGKNNNMDINSENNDEDIDMENNNEKNGNNNSKSNEDEEIILDLPSSNDDNN